MCFSADFFTATLPYIFFKIIRSRSILKKSLLLLYRIFALLSKCFLGSCRKFFILYGSYVPGLLQPNEFCTLSTISVNRKMGDAPPGCKIFVGNISEVNCFEDLKNTQVFDFITHLSLAIMTKPCKFQVQDFFSLQSLH